MKIAVNKFYFLIAFLFGTLCAIAQPPPPPGDDIPVVPIDENLFILLAIALLYGIYIIYNYRSKTKTPI